MNKRLNGRISTDTTCSLWTNVSFYKHLFYKFDIESPPICPCSLLGKKKTRQQEGASSFTQNLPQIHTSEKTHKPCRYNEMWETKKNEARIVLDYLRSPPALSAGPHMENQASSPLGTDVCSPLESPQPASQPATEAVWERGRLTTTYSHKSFTPGTEEHNSAYWVK